MLLRLEMEYLAQRNHFIGKLEKDHTKLTNIDWTQSPMCEYIDGIFFTRKAAYMKWDSQKKTKNKITKTPQYNFGKNNQEQQWGGNKERKQNNFHRWQLLARNHG